MRQALPRRSDRSSTTPSGEEAAVTATPPQRTARSSFARGFLVLFAGSAVGKVAGVLREAVFAAAFGAGPVAAGFKTAQTAALVSANLFTGDLLASAFTPTYARLIADDARAAARLLWGYLTTLASVLLVVAVVLFTLRSAIVGIIIPGASPDVQSVGAEMLGALGWCVPLYGVASVAGYALGTHGDYLAASLRATLQTVGLLVGTIATVVLHQVTLLAYGYVAAWVCYTTWCLIRLARRRMLHPSGFTTTLRAGALVGRSVSAVLPLAVVPVALQLAAVLERVFASHGPSELIAATDYSHILSDSLITLLSVPLGFVGLTQFSKLAEGDVGAAVRRLVRAVVTFGLPASLGVIPLTGVLVDVMYHRGAFGTRAVELTSAVTGAMLLGLGAQVLGYTLTRVLSGRRRNRAVLGITLAAVTAQIVVQALAVPLRAPVFLGWGAAAYGIVLTILSCWMLGVLSFLMRLIVASTPAIAVSIAVMTMLSTSSPWLQSGVLGIAWAANLAVVREFRTAFADVGRTIRGRRGRRATGA